MRRPCRGKPEQRSYLIRRRLIVKYQTEPPPFILPDDMKDGRRVTFDSGCCEVRTEVEQVSPQIKEALSLVRRGPVTELLTAGPTQH